MCLLYLLRWLPPIKRRLGLDEVPGAPPGANGVPGAGNGMNGLVINWQHGGSIRFSVAKRTSLVGGGGGGVGVAAGDRGSGGSGGANGARGSNSRLSTRSPMRQNNLSPDKLAPPSLTAISEVPSQYTFASTLSMI